MVRLLNCYLIDIFVDTAAIFDIRQFKQRAFIEGAFIQRNCNVRSLKVQSDQLIHCSDHINDENLFRQDKRSSLKTFLIELRFLELTPMTSINRYERI